MEYLVKFLCLLLMCQSVVLGQDIAPEFPVDFPTTSAPTTEAIPTTTTEMPLTTSTTTTTTTEMPLTTSTTTTTTTEMPLTTSTTTTTTTELPSTTTRTTTTELPTTTTKKSTTTNRPTPSTSSSPYYPGYTNRWTACYQKQYTQFAYYRLRCGEYTYRPIFTCYRCCYHGPNGCYKLHNGLCRGHSIYSYPF